MTTYMEKAYAGVEELRAVVDADLARLYDVDNSALVGFIAFNVEVSGGDLWEVSRCMDANEKVSHQCKGERFVEGRVEVCPMCGQLVTLREDGKVPVHMLDKKENWCVEPPEDWRK